MQKKMLRFKEFNDYWQIKRLGNYVEEIMETPLEEKIPLYSLTIENGLVPKTARYERSFLVKDEANAYKICYKNNFAINPMNLRFGAIARHKEDFPILVSKYYNIFKVSNAINIGFFEIYMRTPKILNYFDRNSTGSLEEKKRVHFSNFVTFEIPFPSLLEQQKIADFLSKVDEKIEKLTKKKELLEQYKKGVMQKIFSQEIRFKYDSGNDFPEWEEKELGELCNITTGKLDANAMVQNGEYRFYTCAKEYYFIDNYAFDTEALLISGNGANVGYIHYYKGKFNAYQRTYVLDGFIHDMIYIKYYLDKNLKNRILSEKKEGNTPYIVLSTLSEMKMNIPSLPEQQKIADFLSALDKKIDIVYKELGQVQEFKKGLLQQMFV